MGSLYWQLDDCWPVASWSSIDYFGRWKALQYYARHFYSPLLLSPLVEANSLNFYVVSDLVSPTNSVINVELRDLDGNKLSTLKKEAVVTPLKSKSYFAVPLKSLLEGRDTKNLMVYCELLVDGKVMSSNEYFFEPYKNLSLPTANISANVTPARNGFKVTVTTDKLARAVYLSTRTQGFFTENYFDLIPGKPVELQFQTTVKIPVEKFREQLKIRSLKDAFNSSNSTEEVR